METNYCRDITMQDYDNAVTESEKRAIAQGFEECRNKTTELNIKFLVENEALKAENERLKNENICMRLDIEDYDERERKRHAEKMAAIKEYEEQVKKIVDVETFTVKPMYFCSKCGKELNIEAKLKEKP